MSCRKCTCARCTGTRPLHELDRSLGVYTVAPGYDIAVSWTWLQSGRHMLTFRRRHRSAKHGSSWQLVFALDRHQMLDLARRLRDLQIEVELGGYPDPR